MTRRHPTRSFLFQCRLSGGQASDGDSKWGAAYVVEADSVAELDAVGVAAVFAADADFEVLVVLRFSRGAALRDADLD